MNGIIYILVFKVLLLANLPANPPGQQAKGRVLEVDEETRSLLVEFETGQTTLVKVAPGDLMIGYEGSDVEGVLEESGQNLRLNSIWPHNEIHNNAMNGVNRSIIREAATMGRADSLARGDYLPDFALFNHRGQPVYARDLRKQPMVMSFIFTRCGDPSMCPATSQRMAELGTRLEKSGLTDPRLVLVSFDPEYDTPGILRQYSDALGMDSNQFELLTGDKETIMALLRLTGVRTIHEDGTIVHNLVTLLTDDHGRIILRQDGSRWSADAIFEKLARTPQ